MRAQRVGEGGRAFASGEIEAEIKTSGAEHGERDQRNKKETLSGGCKKFTASPTALLFKGMIPPVSTLLERSLFVLELSRVPLSVTATLMPRLLFLLFLSIFLSVSLSFLPLSDFCLNLSLLLFTSVSLHSFLSGPLSISNYFSPTALHSATPSPFPFKPSLFLSPSPSTSLAVHLYLLLFETVPRPRPPTAPVVYHPFFLGVGTKRALST